MHTDTYIHTHMCVCTYISLGSFKLYYVKACLRVPEAPLSGLTVTLSR